MLKIRSGELPAICQSLLQKSVLHEHRIFFTILTSLPHCSDRPAWKHNRIILKVDFVNSIWETCSFGKIWQTIRLGICVIFLSWSASKIKYLDVAWKYNNVLNVWTVGRLETRGCGHLCLNYTCFFSCYFLVLP